jgi:hypothetical protein
MAQGLFITGFTVAEVLQIQAKAKEMLVEGIGVRLHRAVAQIAIQQLAIDEGIWLIIESI